jgi:hypothetical protein
MDKGRPGGPASAREDRAVKPFCLSALSFALLLVTSTVSSEAEAGKSHPRLRAQIRELRVQVAQLAAHVDFMNRSEDSGTPVGGVDGNGWNMCGDPCSTDSDGDGVGDCEDYCPCDPDIADSDGDAVPDCADPCPDDATDACADPCRQDSDGDDSGDCEDPCPYDRAPPVDADADGVFDCQDMCPTDPANQCWDWCELDQDGDGVSDCKDPCPWATEAGMIGCEVPRASTH